MILPLTIFLSISIVIFTILYPAFWVDPKKIFFLRYYDSSMRTSNFLDIWEYMKEMRLIDPLLILGVAFVIIDWIKKRKDFLHFIAIGGILYLSIYLLTFIVLTLSGKLNFAFLEGFYRYTFPAIPILALYFFARSKDFIKNKNLWLILISLLFAREIIFSPFLFF